jgi:TetR/AcrR family transcriptional repressor of nem operon
MRKSERTKEYILRKVAPVFNQKGFAGTSLSDLTEATGLTKGCLYGNFATKEDIAVEAFLYGVGEIREAVRTRVDTRLPAVEQLFALLEFYRQYASNPVVPGGCVLLNTAIEADDNQPALKKKVAVELKRPVQFIRQLLIEAVRAGDLKPEGEAKSIAFSMFCAIEGAIMIARVQNNMTAINEVTGYWKSRIESWRTR